MGEKSFSCWQMDSFRRVAAGLVEWGSNAFNAITLIINNTTCLKSSDLRVWIGGIQKSGKFNSVLPLASNEDEFSNTSGVSNWTCTCSSGNQSYILKSNCSRSCDCNPVESSGDRWTCVCATNGFPEVAVDNHDTTCFTACNCTAGIFFRLRSPNINVYFEESNIVQLLFCAVNLTVDLI
ncbi:receptor-like serine/threonine-protein kinase NCRK isoform X1 [Gossypium australe]|uniref:Receptor-like serine/threonine-protein kinase NCRK isoform X1 n=1 Tax=Gossypium australe TaxID=47621 RepID=A0A5B6X5V3_9ROSI|nr:receptor-like serine/threonine-protein kinase NCRK isoform X1 [Gossypium australe]